MRTRQRISPDLSTLPIREAWQAALTASFHAPNCSCAGGAFFAITADTLEEDLLDYLDPRYPTSRSPDVAAALLTRRTERRSSFPAWLSELSTVLSASAYAQLEADVQGVLNTITGRTTRFSCS